MKKEFKMILISLIVMLSSLVIICFEMKSYTPVDKNETEIIKNYDKITEKMNEIINKENSFEKRLKKELKFAEKIDKETQKIIEQYGIKEVLEFEITPKNSEARKKICALHNCDSKEMKINSFWGIDNVSVVEFDFNDDGKKEIIGNWHGNYAHKGACLDFIDDNTSKNDVSQFVCNALTDKIIVLNHKTNGYWDIVITTKTFMGIPYKDVFKNYF